MSSFSRNMERTFSENELNALASAWDGHRQAVCCEGIKLILQDWWVEIIKFLAVLKLIFTDFCNVLWGLREMYRWNHNIKMTIVGFTSMGLAHRYVLKPFEGNYIISIPLGFVVCGCLVKISQYINLYMINNPNSAFGSKPNRDYAHLPNDQFKLRKALYYTGFSQLNPGDEVRMEFAKGLKENLTEWWNSRNCDSDKLGTKNVICNTLLCPTHKGSGTKDDPIDLTEDSDKEDNDLDDVDSGEEGDEDTNKRVKEYGDGIEMEYWSNEDDKSDKEVEHYCCNGENCDNEGEFEDLQEAYDNGWYQNDEANYCGECAEEEIEKVDNEANNKILKKHVLDAYGIRPENPGPESEENKKDK